MRYAFALLFCPVIASAGVTYDFGVQQLDQSNLAAARPGAAAAAPAVTRYFVDKDRVRVGAPGAKRVYLIEDRTVYVIDEASRTIRVLKHAALSDVAAHYADAVRQLRQAAVAAPPAERAGALRKADALMAESDRLLQPAPREYRMTSRFEAVDGQGCRIWEEREADVKRLELCVAPTGAVPGGADLLNGMNILSEFRQGAQRALGVDFGLSAWWPDMVHLGGLPLLIREFKYDSLVSEVTLTAIRPGIQSASLWMLPEGYRLEEVADYDDW
jgi:hypothetical protein